MLSTKLLPYQSEHIQKIIKIFNGKTGHSRNGVVLCTPWGSGKTLMCIESSLRIGKIISRQNVEDLNPGEKTPILVITQKTIIDGWAMNGRTHYKPPLQSTFIGGTNAGSHNAMVQNWCLIKNNHLVITNYETLVNAYKVVIERRKVLIEAKLRTQVLTRERRAVLEKFLQNHCIRPSMDVLIPDEELSLMERVQSMTDSACAFYYHRWSTIVVDEGHELRNNNSNAFVAISQLRAHFKIVATADPFNNSIQDIVSLFMICGIPPGIDPESTKRKGRNCVHDYCALLPKDAPCAIALYGVVPGTCVEKLAHFSKKSSSVIREWSTLSRQQSAVTNFCKALIICRDHYIIQQDEKKLKNHYKPTTIVINPEFISDEERKMYDFIRKKDCPLKEKPGNKFSMFSRSRHACSGLYHTEDINAFFMNEEKTKHRGLFQGYDEKHSVYSLPTMILAIIYYLQAVPIKRKEKSIVFVDFKQSVVEVAAHIRRTIPHISVFEADSKAQMSQRDAILKKFEETKGPAVLVTTRIFSQGVNIECANHVIIADTWWNFVITDQSESRVMRPSQKKSVFIVKIIIRNTVEELMWTVSECKRKISGQVMKEEITPNLVRKITTLNAVDAFKANMILLEDYISSSSSASISSSTSSTSSSSSMFSIDNPDLFKIMQRMIEKSNDVYIRSVMDLCVDESRVPSTIPLTPFVSTTRTITLVSSTSSSSSSSSLLQRSATQLPPVQKLSRVNTMIKGNYHHRRFTPIKSTDRPYEKLISRPSLQPSKRQIVEIDEFGRVVDKRPRTD
jgi:SNF2 family DNA or RNA helicase